MNKQLSQHVLNILEWPAVIKKLESLCATPGGKFLVNNLEPLPLFQVKIRMKKISHLKELQLRGDTLHFGGITNIEPFLTRAEKDSILSLDELAKIKSFIMGSERIKAFLKEWKEEFDTLTDEFIRLDPLDIIGKLLIESITDKNELSPQKYPQLKRIADNIFSAKQEIEKAVSKIISSPHMDNILQEKIYTTVNQRYVLLVRSNMKNKIQGTVHDISSSGATVYFEPDKITGLNNKIIMLELDLQREISRILKTLSLEVGTHSPELRNNFEIISFLDCINAASKFSIATNSNEPEISEEPEIILFDAIHPLLHLMQPGSVISNNVELGKDFNCLIISGANTGGKTVLLKTLGLCVLLAMYGLHIPAREDSTIGIFTNILADIGDDQSLEQSLSTYSGQIVIINEMLKKADNRTLVLIDEIIVGTNPRQGAALAQAILESLADTGSRIVSTTHYTELKELASGDSRFENASVSFDMETLKPTYRLITGLPGVSYAMEIARNYGLLEKVISRSRELLDSSDFSLESLLEKVQKYEQELTEERLTIRSLKDELAAEKDRFILRQKEIEKLTKEVKNREGIDFLKELDRYRESIAQRITDLQNLDSREAGKAGQEINEIKEKVSGTMEKENRDSTEDEYRPLDLLTAKPGDRVYIASLEKEGKIESIDSSGKSAQVLFGGSIKSRFKTDDLYYPPPSTSYGSDSGKKKNDFRTVKKPAPKQTAPADGVIPFTMQTAYNTIDMRGKRVEEALSLLGQELDHMSRSGVSSVVIIHGHGTGALKTAVRENLKTSIYVADYRPGESGEGGDGVSIALLRV
ncbi:MAG: endonuclease MutS2 [bacterium]|nr:endonuclease MutS2 [bacterium]